MAVNRFFLPLLIALPLAAGAQTYKDPSQPVGKRVDDLISRMTVEEKVGQMMHGARAIPRLGVPAYNWWSEGLHGVGLAGTATVFPQSIGLGATFDPALIHTIATAISDEARVKHRMAVKQDGSTPIFHGLTYWSPNINIFRDPRWGRGQETYGEDPYLTARMGVAFVTGMQGNDPKYLKLVATPKHYAVHSGPDPMRHTFNAVVSQQDLNSTYLPAFEACVRDGKAFSIMSAYSSLYGVPDSASSLLLQHILRDRWGFQGYVVSDCGAINDIMTGHHYAKTLAEAAADAVNAGCDVECGDAYNALTEAVQQGLVKEATLDKSLHRLFTARMRLGMFDPPSMVPWERIPNSALDSAQHRSLALQAARESIVLLQNKGNILPLKKYRTIGVIGPNADNVGVLLGNYNGEPSRATTPLQGIQEQAAGVGTRVLYTQGSELSELSSVHPVPAGVLFPESGAKERGLKGEYFDNMEFRGSPALTRIDPQINFDWAEGSPAPGLPIDHFSVRWTGLLVPDQTGDYSLGATCDDGMRVWIDGKKVLDDWSDHAARTSQATMHLEKGRAYDIKIEYYDNEMQAVAKFGWAPPNSNPYDEAIWVAKQSDLVVMVCGISGDIENEEHDRTTLQLPKVQQDLLRAVKSQGKPIVLVLVNGSPIDLRWATANADAIVEAWYPGEEGGRALGDVLFGKYNPAGRLPVTFYDSDAQLPPFEDYNMGNRTYRFMGERPLFPFGYGLSYTRFAYSNLRLPGSVSSSGPAVVSATVTNVGAREGDEVAELYLTHGRASGVPNIELKGMQRLHLRPGEAQTVQFRLTAKELSTVEKSGERWVRSGRLGVSIGCGQPGFVSSPQFVGGILRIVGRGTIVDW